MSGHFCQGGAWREGVRGWELVDARGVYCGRVCERCEAEKRARYRPEILTSYDENDVNEAIDGEEGEP
jgi:hypothetical protein